MGHLHDHRHVSPRSSIGQCADHAVLSPGRRRSRGSAVGLRPVAGVSGPRPALALPHHGGPGRNGHRLHVGPRQQPGEPLLFALAPHRLRRRQLGGVRLRRHVQPLLPVAHRDVRLAGRPARHRRPSAQPVCLRRSHEAAGGGRRGRPDDAGSQRGAAAAAKEEDKSRLPVLPDGKTRAAPLHPVRHLGGGGLLHPASLLGAFRQQFGDGQLLARLPPLRPGAGRPGGAAALRVGGQRQAGEEPAAARRGGRPAGGGAPAAARQPRLLDHPGVFGALRLPAGLRGGHPRHFHRGHRDAGGLRQRTGTLHALQERRRVHRPARRRLAGGPDGRLQRRLLPLGCLPRCVGGLRRPGGPPGSEEDIIIIGGQRSSGGRPIANPRCQRGMVSERRASFPAE